MEKEHRLPIYQIDCLQSMAIITFIVDIQLEFTSRSYNDEDISSRLGRSEHAQRRWPTTLQQLPRTPS